MGDSSQIVGDKARFWRRNVYVIDGTNRIENVFNLVYVINQWEQSKTHGTKFVNHIPMSTTTWAMLDPEAEEVDEQADTEGLY